MSKKSTTIITARKNERGTYEAVKSLEVKRSAQDTVARVSAGSKTDKYDLLFSSISNQLKAIAG